MNHLMLAAISGNDVVQAIVWLVVAGLIYYVAAWGLGKIGLGEPFGKIANVLLVLLVVVMVINAILMLVGKPFIRL